MSNSDLDKIFRLREEKDWVLWKFQITILLKHQEVYSYVTGDKKMPDANDLKYESLKEAFEKGDIKAQRAIVTTIEKEAMLHLVNCKTSAEMWSKLKSVYEQKSETSVHFLQQKFFTFEKEQTESIATYIAKLQELAQQLADLGETVSDKMLMTKILMSLPPTLKHFHSAWEATQEDKKTINELTSRLMVEETRATVFETAEDRAEESAFYARKRRTPKDFEGQKSEKSSRRGNCYRCGSSSHWKAECPERPKSYDRKERDGDAFCGYALVTKTERDAWYLDSGATEHMTGRRDWFKTYTELTQHLPVRIGNGEVIMAVGVGDIDVRAFNGKRWIERRMMSVWHVPKIFVNLFSQGRCLDKGSVMRAKRDRCEFVRDGSVVGVGVRESGLYRMLIETNTNTVEHFANAAVVEDIRVWHERLAHQNLTQVKTILNRNGIKFIDDQQFQCEACIYGKQHRLSFGERKEKSSACGEIIHADVCGPIQTMSLGGARYFLLLKDDYSHYRYVFFLRQKSEVAGKVIAFIKLLQTQTLHKVKIFRSDNGTEFVNNELSQYFERKGILHQRTVPYTPEQNGCCERENRTVMEAARTMLHARDLMQQLWAEAVNMAVYVLNRTGTSTVKKQDAV